MSTGLASPPQATDQALERTENILLTYFLFGIFFGITLTRSEVLSWFRIQEMFRFQSPRMYEIIASAVVVAAAPIAAIKRLGLKDLSGKPITIPPKSLGGVCATQLAAPFLVSAGPSRELVRDRCSLSWAMA